MSIFEQLANNPLPQCRVDNVIRQAERFMKHIELERLLESMEEWWKSLGIQVLESDTKRLSLEGYHDRRNSR